MNAGAQRICAWAGIASIAVFFVGFWPLAHFLPPMRPSLTPSEVAAIFHNNATGILINSMLMLLSSGLLVMLYAGISVQLKRIEGASSPMTYAQLATGTLAVVPFVPAAVAWCVAAYRPERDEQLVYLMNDFAWIMLFMVAAPAMLQFICIGVAVLRDQRDQPILPRWYGYFTLWCALLGTPGSIIVLFKHGPFAWSGLFGYWIPATLFGIWTITTSVMLLSAIRREHSEA